MDELTQQVVPALEELEPAVPVPEPARLAMAPVLDLAQLSVSARGPQALEAKESLRRRLLVAADVVALTTTFAVVLHRPIGTRSLTALFAVAAGLLLFKLAGLYTRDELRLHHSTLDEAPLLLQLTGFFALGSVILTSSLSVGRSMAGEVGTLWLAAFTTVLLGRIIVRTGARRFIPAERCLVIGDVVHADRIRARVASSGAPTNVVGCVPVDEICKDGDGLSAMSTVVRRMRIDRIIVASSSPAAAEAAELVRIAKGTGVRVSLVVPELLETAGSAVAFDELEGMMMLGLPRFGLRRSAGRLKRGFDVCAAGLGLLAVSPLLTVIAVLIKLDSRGSVFFRQTRIGRYGIPFDIVKFRSMVDDAETHKESLRVLSIGGPGLFKLVDDPRVTRVGRFLRRTSLDELPQLVNVLRGSMTLVGPRPLVPDEDAQILGLGRSRLLLTPGLTGPWQLMGSRVPLQEMVEIDYLYASSWSLWLDLKILLRTVRHVVRRANL